jgi:hypothetical protein
MEEPRRMKPKAFFFKMTFAWVIHFLIEYPMLDFNMHENELEHLY